MQRIGPCVFALVLASGCGKKSPDDSGTEGATWEDAFDTSAAGSLSGVWGSGPDDVFVVGGSDAGAEIHHFDGSAWAEMAPPAGAGLLVWAYGFSPSEVYAVGMGGGAWRYDGASWSSLGDTGTTAPLWGVWGTSGSDLWMVGGEVDGGEPVILHWDGATFTSIALDPAQNSRAAKALFKVWGIDGTVFAVGQGGLVIRWDGGAWVETGAGPDADRDFVSLWGTSASHIVAVGGRANGRVATWDGSAWTTEAPSGLGGLNAVFIDDPDTAMIGGVNGFVGTLDVASGAIEREVPTNSLDVHAMWGDGEGRTYAVGGTFLDGSHAGTAMVRTAP